MTMMKEIFNRSMFKYVLMILFLTMITGGILSLIVTNYIILVAMMLMQFIIMTLILLHLFDRYIKPIHKAVNMVTELAEGNYSARIHHPSNGTVGKLSNKINRLARNLSKITTHEQMQSEQLSTVIDNTESGLALIDEKGYIHLVNRKFVDIFGKKAKDYVGHLYYEILSNEKIHETVQKTFLYEKNIKDSMIITQKIERKYLEIVGAPIFDHQNNLKGAVLVFYDITELKNLELMRKDFVANVSHELKTPITSIRGFAETLVDGAVNDQEACEEFVGIIYEESQRLQVLIEELLVLSRLEQYEPKLNYSPVNVNGLLEEIESMISHRAKDKEISYIVEAKDILMINADKEKLKQVFINLLLNAISYTPEQGKVTLRLDEVDDHIQIRVKDTGIGIDAKFIPRIFERFYRVDKARSRNTGGTGLGLAIVKHIVEAHNGKIVVDSKLNEGTTFTVLLPKNFE